MSEPSGEFKNGFNYCIEKSLSVVNEIFRGTYPLSTSPAELLLEVKEKILSMHYIGIGIKDRETHEGFKERNR